MLLLRPRLQPPSCPREFWPRGRSNFQAWLKPEPGTPLPCVPMWNRLRAQGEALFPPPPHVTQLSAERGRVCVTVLGLRAGQGGAAAQPTLPAKEALGEARQPVGTEAHTCCPCPETAGQPQLLGGKTQTPDLPAALLRSWASGTEAGQRSLNG